MILQGSSGERFELGIVRYEFGNETDLHDRNWLIVRVDAESGTSRWGGQDPCLLTWEAQELAAWLAGVAADEKGTSANLEFMEPELSFHVQEHVADGVALRIGTRYRLAGGSGVTDQEQESVAWSAKVSRLQIRGAAEDLANELKRWPER